MNSNPDRQTCLHFLLNCDLSKIGSYPTLPYHARVGHITLWLPSVSGEIAAALPPYQFRPRSGPSKAMCLPSRLRSSPRLISTGQLHASQRFHLRPINVIVYDEPYSIKDERSNLRGSFTLRCLQRLSRPNVATQLCPWQDNWCTRGSSIPVLSY